MSWFAWSLSVLIVVLALLYVSPRLRKTAFIWFTYMSLTGWYYFRLWEKKRHGNSSSGGVGSPTSKKPASKLHTDSSNSSISAHGSSSCSAPSFASSRPVRQDEADIEDVVYFESVEKLQQRELRHGSERSARLSASSSSGNSGYSDDSLAKLPRSGRGQSQQQQTHPKSHLGIFRSLRKSHREDDKRRDSDMSSTDPLARSTVSEPGGGATRTRRTYTGRKKPPSWAD